MIEAEQLTVVFGLPMMYRALLEEHDSARSQCRISAPRHLRHGADADP